MQHTIFRLPRLIYPIFLLTLIVGCQSENTKDSYLWQDIDQVWEHEPDRVRALINALDITNPALAKVNEALQAGDTIAGCQAILAHFQKEKKVWVAEAFDDQPTEEDALTVAKAFLQDSFVHGITIDKIPSLKDGGWKWNHHGANDDAEFAYSLNAQSYLGALYLAWQENKDVKNLEVSNFILQDWIRQHPVPSPNDSIYHVLNKTIPSLDYRDIGEVEWRTLDTGKRLGATWPQLFHAMQGQKSFTPATRLLMLCSIVEQAEYLMKYHKTGHNWITMEMNGLALVGLAFPEYKHAKLWSNYALDIMSKEINRQVYPDGVQTEISSKTQWVALRRFKSIAANFKKAGRPVTASYVNRIEDMYNFLAYAMRPNGNQPLNNDSDLEDLRPRVLNAYSIFDRPDWQYIATAGQKGIEPSNGPSLTFPWAGIVLMRNGWNSNADWSLFDIGPYGTGHQHRDMLHISLSAFGKDLLVDGGRYTHRDYFSFDPTVWRGYFRSSLSHNTILVDGKGQMEGPFMAEEPLEEGRDYIHAPTYDVATGTFSNGYESIADAVEHTRSVVYLKNHTWLVVDRIKSKMPHEITVLWHAAPDFEVKMKESTAQMVDAQRIQFSVTPLNDLPWDINLVKGQEKPHIQGWYSSNYNEKTPNSTLEYKFNVQGTQNFAWLISANNTQDQTASHTYEITDKLLKVSIHQKQNTRIEFPLNHQISAVKVHH